MEELEKQLAPTGPTGVSHELILFGFSSSSCPPLFSKTRQNRPSGRLFYSE